MSGLWRGLIRDDNGRVTAFVALITAACLLFAGLVLDGGLALATKIQAIGQAEEAARAGAQELDLAAYRDTGTLRLQPAAAISAAQSYLNSVDANATVTVTGNSVNVSVTAREKTELLGLIGIHDITVSGDGHAQPNQGQLGVP